MLAGYGETLPVESVVIELLETIDGDADVVAACKKLKQGGYLVALDDFVYRPELEPLLELAEDYIADGNVVGYTGGGVGADGYQIAGSGNEGTDF